MDALSKIGKKYEMKINVKKTKVMIVCRDASKIEIVEQVKLKLWFAKQRLASKMIYALIFTWSGDCLIPKVLLSKYGSMFLRIYLIFQYFHEYTSILS